MLMHRPQTPQPGFGSITLLQKFTPPFQNPGSAPATMMLSLGFSNLLCAKVIRGCIFIETLLCFLFRIYNLQSAIHPQRVSNVRM